MQTKIKIGANLLALSVALLFLVSCGKKNKLLDEIYYAQHDTSGNDLVIMAFSYKHPNEVAVRVKYTNGWLNVIFPISYRKNSVFITRKDNTIWKHNISKDHRTLTCPSCDGVAMPKIYTVGMEKGEPYGRKTAESAFETIFKDSKVNGGMSPLNEQ